MKELVRKLFESVRNFFKPKVVQISLSNTKVCKISNFGKAILSTFYNISRPNFAILLILEWSFYSYGKLFCSCCSDQNLANHWNSAWKQWTFNLLTPSPHCIMVVGYFFHSNRNGRHETKCFRMFRLHRYSAVYKLSIPHLTLWFTRG